MSNSSKKKQKNKVVTDKSKTTETKQQKQDRFYRQIGKIGCGIFVIGVAVFFELPEFYRNLYLTIAASLMLYDPLKRAFLASIGKIEKSSNHNMDILMVGVTVFGIGFGQYLAAAVFITICEIADAIKNRPI